MSNYIETVIENCKKNNPGEVEFHQTVEEVLRSLEPVIEKHPEYQEAAILERLVEPERGITFKVTWLTMLVKYRLTKVTDTSSTVQSDLTKVV